MIDTSFLQEIKKFDLVIKKRVISQYSGERESEHTGEGLIFKDFKDYVMGDDFRAVDWKVYARTDKLFIRRYEEERNMTIHIIIDSSGSMDYGDKVTKFEYASMIGLGLAFLAIKNNEKYELSTFAEKMQMLNPKKGKSQLVTTIDYLNRIKPQGKSKFLESIDSFKKRLKSKSMIVILSDFLYDTEEIDRVVNALKRSQLELVQILDKGEVNLNLQGDNMLKDSETGGILRTFISNRLKQNYKNNMEHHSKKIKDICDRAGADYVQVNNSMRVFDSMYEVLK